MIAVGKADDALGLPFPVLDDGTDERAPVFGVIAGLRAATHETCLVLPVDCPLVTPELLSDASRPARSAGRAAPGVYTRRCFPTSSRVATGSSRCEASTGPCSTCRRAAPAPTSTREWTSSRGHRRLGTRDGGRTGGGRRRVDARRESPADRWSDLDVLLVVDEPDLLCLRRRGSRSSAIPCSRSSRRRHGADRARGVCSTTTAEDVDFPILALPGLDRLMAAARCSRAATGCCRRDRHRVRLREVASSREEPHADAAAFTELASDFWYHALWAAKKLAAARCSP